MAVVLALPLTLLFAQWGYELYMMRCGGRIAAQLESYRLSHGQYPVSLSELGITDTTSGIYHYQRDDSSSLLYYLWFGTGFECLLPSMIQRVTIGMDRGRSNHALELTSARSVSNFDMPSIQLATVYPPRRGGRTSACFR